MVILTSMSIFFESIDPKNVEKFFNEFFHKDALFFEIMSNNISNGFLGVKKITKEYCEICVYIYNKLGRSLTKEISLNCLSFPFSLGFRKIFINTELEKMKRFLCKLTNHGVNYLFTHNNIHLFEVVNNGKA
jgi:hypothetical protein